MGESRDANDPRDLLRAMNKEARAEFEDEEMGDTGGQEHASRADREGVPHGRRPDEAATEGSTRATREQDRTGPMRVPHGDVVTGAAEREVGAPAEPRSVPDRDE